jgi:hypothetical protein
MTRTNPENHGKTRACRTRRHRFRHTYGPRPRGGPRSRIPNAQSRGPRAARRPTARPADEARRKQRGHTMNEAIRAMLADAVEALSLNEALIGHAGDGLPPLILALAMMRLNGIVVQLARFHTTLTIVWINDTWEGCQLLTRRAFLPRSSFPGACDGQRGALAGSGRQNALANGWCAGWGTPFVYNVGSGLNQAGSELLAVARDRRRKRCRAGLSLRRPRRDGDAPPSPSRRAGGPRRRSWRRNLTWRPAGLIGERECRARRAGAGRSSS